MRAFFLVIIFVFAAYGSMQAQSAQVLLDRGWKALIIDEDTTALRCFALAYETAMKENDAAGAAEALLHMGMVSYSSSYTAGMEYASDAMEQYKKLEQTSPDKARQGRAKCLQLIATIYGRQGKLRESIRLSQEALQAFPKTIDGYPGLIYNSLGTAYSKLGLQDSAAHFHLLALKSRLAANDFVYLPASYVNVGNILLEQKKKEESLQYYTRALTIADSMNNRQAQVSALLALGSWQERFGEESSSDNIYVQATDIARGLTDRSFYVRTLSVLMEKRKKQQRYPEALALQQQIIAINDSLNSYEKEKLTKSLEIQFEVAEKDRALEIVRKDHRLAQLTNYLLAALILFLAAIAGAWIYFQRKVNRRDKQLLEAKDALAAALEKEQTMRAQQMRNEIEYREQQLNAMTLQMVQKSELLQTLKEQLEQNKEAARDANLNKIINKGLSLDKEWSDLNAQFESVNKNFYERVRQAYPGISVNDLKLCALIRLNLSIKEMAGILNISPDSVKTARYRLRKKFSLNTEDNLTEFLLQL